MQSFLIIDTEEFQIKVKVTHTQINSLKPIIKKVNKDLNDYKDYESYPLFLELINSMRPINEDDITSINILYHI
jgi:hypothetical protein